MGWSRSIAARTAVEPTECPVEVRSASPFGGEWLMRMPAPQRRRFLHNNPRFQRLPQPQRQRIQQRLREFDRMPARQRELLLERYELFGQLSPQEQQRARGIYQRWRQVPAGRRKELMTEFQQLRQAAPDNGIPFVEAHRKRFPVEDFLADMRVHEPSKLGFSRRAFPLHRPKLAHTVEVGRGQLDSVYVVRPRVMNEAIGEEQQRANGYKL